MIVDRKEFKKFWKIWWNLPEIIFCNDLYYLPSLEELNSKIIPLYKNIIYKHDLLENSNWSCSKFSQAFKLVCDFYYKDETTKAHIAVGIAHLELRHHKNNHALNIIFYRNKDKVDYIFFDPQILKIYSDRQQFKDLKFLYF